MRIATSSLLDTKADPWSVKKPSRIVKRLDVDTLVVAICPHWDNLDANVWIWRFTQVDLDDATTDEFDIDRTAIGKIVEPQR